jgi:hypothetical protein
VPLTVREVQGEILVRDRGTSVLGITQINDQDQNNMIGPLEDPILGNLFRNKTRTEKHDELLILLLPGSSGSEEVRTMKKPPSLILLAAGGARGRLHEQRGRQNRRVHHGGLTQQPGFVSVGVVAPVQIDTISLTAV